MKRADRQKFADADLRSVMSTPAGRRFVWRLLTQAGLQGSSFASDPLTTAYNEGRRSVAISLLREAQRAAPELYTQALREQLEHELDDALDAKQDAPAE